IDSARKADRWNSNRPPRAVARGPVASAAPSAGMAKIRSQSWRKGIGAVPNASAVVAALASRISPNAIGGRGARKKHRGGWGSIGGGGAEAGRLPDTGAAHLLQDPAERRADPFLLGDSARY